MIWILEMAMEIRRTSVITYKVPTTELLIQLAAKGGYDIRFLPLDGSRHYVSAS